MPFDPAQPANNSALSSQVMRDQLNSLKAITDAIVQIIAAQVDGVTTLNPGDPASATVSVGGDTLHFTFSIPRGDEGLAGQPGIDGAVGPPFAQAIIDAVNTLNPGDNATVSVSFDGTNVRFTFGIPRGADGAVSPPITSFLVDAVNTLNPGENATVQATFDGSSVRLVFNIPRGQDGSAGAPGEVSNAQLAAAISGTSSNTNGVSTMDIAFTNDPPTLADMELMRAKYNELVLAARRA